MVNFVAVLLNIKVLSFDNKNKNERQRQFFKMSIINQKKVKYI